jgi:hypothetical protein
MDNLAERRSALRELADDLRRWARVCRDQNSALRDDLLAQALDNLAAECDEDRRVLEPSDPE